MTHLNLKMCFILMVLFFRTPSFAADVNADSKGKKPTVLTSSEVKPLAKEESWYVSGVVKAEDGTAFGYYFALLRKGEAFTNQTTVMDLNKGTLLLSESNEATIPLAGRKGIHFKVGSAFLRYNQINKSWVFGIDKAEGFNFRLESLEEGPYPTNHLNQFSFYTIQSKRVNGEISIAQKNRFVVANNAWLTHEWGEKTQQTTLMQRLLCRLGGGKGLMVFRAYDKESIQYDLATLLEPSGESKPVSQFSLITQTKPTSWHVSLIAPEMSFDVETSKPQTIKRKDETIYFYPGLIKNNKDPSARGYCLISKETVVKQQA